MQQAIKFDRVSSKDQRDGFSLEAQRVQGEKYARENSIKIVKAWSVDESASKEEDRKHFFQMIDYVVQNKIQHVIFDKVDRACRGLKSAVKIEELIDHHGVKFHFTREHLIIDSESPPQEKLRFYLGIILGKYYIDNLKSEINKGLEARVTAGLWNGPAPIGYKNVRVGKEQRAVVEVDSENAPIVKEIFELHSTGNYSLDALTKILREKSTRKTCTKRIVEEMLSNPFYYGVMKIRSRRYGKRLEGKVIKGQHEPLIDKDLWDACQKIRGLRKANHQRLNSQTIPKPFMGWMKCGVCGHQVTGETKRKPSGKIYIYYHCANTRCEERRRNISEEQIDAALMQAFIPFSKFTAKATEAFLNSMEDRLTDLDVYTQVKTAEICKERAELKKEILELDRLYQKGKVSESIYCRIIAEKDALLGEKDIEITAHQAADIKTFEEGRRVIELFHSLYNFMHLSGNRLEKVRLAKSVLSNPILKDGSIQYTYQKPFDVLLDLTNLPAWWRWGESNPRPQVIR